MFYNFLYRFIYLFIFVYCYSWLTWKKHILGVQHKTKSVSVDSNKMTSKAFVNLNGGYRMPTVAFGTGMAKTEDELVAALHAVLEMGYRHIETSVFCEHERIVGNVLKKWFDSGQLKRGDVFVTTKLPPHGGHQDRVEIFLKKSLEDLQLDYVDLYLIQFPIGVQCDLDTLSPSFDANGQWMVEPKSNTASLWKRMEEQVYLGRAKNIGVCNYNIVQMEKIQGFARIKPTVLQIELNVFLQQRHLVDFCQSSGIAVMAYFPVGLPCYGKEKTRGPKCEHLNRFLKSPDSHSCREKDLPNVLDDPVVAKIGRKHGKTAEQVVLRFLLQKGIAYVPKTCRPRCLQESFDVFNFNLDRGDMKTLTNLDVGESARIAKFKFYDGIEKHPEFPLFV